MDAVKKIVHFDSSSKCKFASTLFRGDGRNDYERVSERLGDAVGRLAL